MHTKIYTPKVSAKGLMTLPKEARVALGIKEGDRVLPKVQPDGKVTDLLFEFVGVLSH
ncbi:AbrB/MazE/SpoVT family DNA-binding domain-containing protein [Thermanaeromonas sp.]|uniref:AbrB/MazE/SpoVT family DNA-binding domain-containing protein n=1 Tax=Thermanaeromonas sp. TaxID=2003697 RepID=UPI00342AF412